MAKLKPTQSDERPVERAVSIDQDHLEPEFVRLPADIATWGERYAQALRRSMRGKAFRKRIWAEKFLAIKAKEYEGKSPSEKTIEAMIEQDSDYKDAVDNEIDAEVERVRINGVLDALDAKKDSLISLGAHLRAELSGPPSIRRDTAAMRDVERSKPSRHQDDEDD